MIDNFRTVTLFQRFLDHIQKIAARAGFNGSWLKLQFGLISILRLGGGDIADRCHARQNDLLTLLGLFEIAIGIIAGRRFRQTRQQGSFSQIQLLSGFAKKRSGGRFNPQRAGAEVDLVELSFQYILFAVTGFDLQCNQQFAEFPQIGPLEAEEKILGKLLGNARCPLNRGRFK